MSTGRGLGPVLAKFFAFWLMGCGAAEPARPASVASPSLSPSLASESTLAPASRKLSSNGRVQAEPVVEEEQKGQSPSALDAPAMTESESGSNTGEAEPAKHALRAQRMGLMRRFEHSAPREGESALPMTCASRTGIHATTAPVAPLAVTDCYPPAGYVERLCKGTYLGVAFTWFRPGTPWQRAYVRAKTKAWTTAPGVTDADSLLPGEEVLLLLSDSNPGSQFQVSAGASYYALRWNGTCVKLTEEEVSSDYPPRRRIAAVEWNWIEDGHQEALRTDQALARAEDLRRKSCKGVRGGASDSRCAAADEALRQHIERFVRSDQGLPPPTSLP